MNNTTQNKLADLFAKRFEDYNTKVLEELAGVIKQFNGLTYTQASKLANELKYDKSYIDLVDELSRLTGKSKKEIKKILEETVKQHTEFADTFFKARNMDTPVYQNDKYLKELVTSVANVSEGDFTNLAKSTGFAFLDNKGHIKFLNMQQTYYKVIDDCVYAISEGKATYGESIRKIINQLSDSGVRRIVYANDGKKQYTQRIDTAVRRNILDSIREVSIESQKEFGKRFNADGVEVTVHENPAPDHMNVQGHQFTNEEFDKFQNDKNCKDVNGIEFPATSDETGRDRRSIGQYNCYHTVFSIIVGVSKPLYSAKQLQEIKDRATEIIKIDGKNYTRYEVTQLQRGIETEIRKAKDKHIMFKQVNDKEGMQAEQLRITQLTHKYKEISQKAGLREQLNRAAVSGYRPIKVEPINKIIKNPQTFDEWQLYLENKGIIVEDSTKKMDERLLFRNIEQINNLSNKYNVVDNQKLHIQVVDEDIEFKAETLYRDNKIKLHINTYGDEDKLISQQQGSQDMRWNSKVNKDNLDIYTITHEYGHTIEFDYIRKKIERDYNIDTTIRANNYSKYELDLKRSIDIQIKKEVFNYVKKETGWTPEAIAREYLSRYGRSTPYYEWFAETFAKMELGEEDILTEGLKQWLERNYK